MNLKLPSGIRTTDQTKIWMRVQEARKKIAELEELQRIEFNRREQELRRKVAQKWKAKFDSAKQSLEDIRKNCPHEVQHRTEEYMGHGNYDHIIDCIVCEKELSRI